MTNKTIYGCTPVPSSIDNKYHYVYRITNLVEGKHYYGVKSSQKSPYLVMGKSYFGQPITNDWIIQDQKDNPSHYKYKVLKCFDTRKEANAGEIKLHRKFNVAANPLKFYNGCNSTSDGFWYNLTGKVTVEDSNGNRFRVDKDDPRIGNELRRWNSLTGKSTYRNILTGENKVFSTNEEIPDHYTQVHTGCHLYKDITTGEHVFVPTDHEFVLSKRYVAIATGMTVVYDPELKRNKLITVEEYRSGNYEHQLSERIECIDENGKLRKIKKKEFDPKKYTKIVYSTYRDSMTGECVRATKDNPNVISGRYVGSRTGTTRLKHKDTGEVITVQKNSPLVKSSNYFKISTCPYKNKDTGEIRILNSDDVLVTSGEYVGITKNRRWCVSKTGERIQLEKWDHRIKTGEFTPVNSFD